MLELNQAISRYADDTGIGFGEAMYCLALHGTQARVTKEIEKIHKTSVSYRNELKKMADQD